MIIVSWNINNEYRDIDDKIQMIIEQYSSSIMAQLTSEFLQSIGVGGSEDPLVDIRKRELDLKDKELDMESEQFGLKQNQRQQEKMNNRNGFATKRHKKLSELQKGSNKPEDKIVQQKNL